MMRRWETPAKKTSRRRCAPESLHTDDAALGHLSEEDLQLFATVSVRYDAVSKSFVSSGVVCSSGTCPVGRASHHA